MNEYKILAPSIVILLILFLPVLVFFFLWMMFLAFISGRVFIYSGEITDAAWVAGYSIIGMFLLWAIFKLVKWLKD